MTRLTTASTPQQAQGHWHASVRMPEAFQRIESRTTQEGASMTLVPQGLSTPNTGPVTLLLATQKGAWFLKGARGCRLWEIEGPVFLGHIAHHLVSDPRDQDTLLMAARTGHLGPTVFHSTDDGQIWKEASTPSKFAKASEDQQGRVVNHALWLALGHPNEPDVW
jgi:hypothetical protein